LTPDVAEQIVAGVARACRENGCALLGGETAEMPGFYSPGEYDVAGFIVGLVSRSAVVDGRGIVAGDRLIALPSSGLHTNGYSLARRLAFDVLGLGVDSYVADIGGTVGSVLMTPHRSYLRAVAPLLDGRIKGMAHITGGGISENLPRVLPEGLGFSLDRSSWTVPPVFQWLQAAGRVTDDEMFRAFNMGVGMILVCDPSHADGLLSALRTGGDSAWVLGQVEAGGPKA
jgi:phosphoribosylformylglycinamidine cyclo-ligase